MMNFLKRWWLVALVAVLPFERIPSLDVSLGSHTVTLRLSLIIIAVGIIVFGPMIARRVRLNPFSPYFWLAAYMAVLAASLLGSIDKPRSLIVIVATALAIGAAVIVARVVRLEALPRIQKVLFAATAVAVAFGLYQFIGDIIGLPPSATGLRPNYIKEIFGFPRIQSTGLEPLFFANYLLLPVMLATGLLLGRNQQKSTITYILLFLFILALALTLSRGGMIGGAVGLMALMGLLVRLSSLRVMTGVVTTIGLAALCAAGLIYSATNAFNADPNAGDKAIKRYVKQSTTVTSNKGSADSDRVLNRRLAIEAFQDRPLLGYGIGSFGAYAKSAAPLNYPAKGNHPTVNNEYYEILAETGLAGALALAGFVVALFARLVGTWRMQLMNYHRVWLAALFATCLAYVVQYYAFSTLYIPHIWVTIGLVLGLTGTQARKGATHDKNSHRG